jgi:outer membrane cobalamin receptor
LLRLDPTDRLNATFSARYDDPDSYDGEGTGPASARYDLGAGFSGRRAYGQASDAEHQPDGVRLLLPHGPGGAEAGAGGRASTCGSLASADDRFDAALTAYRIEVEDQIDFVFNPDFTSRYANIDETRSEGLEAEASADLGAGSRPDSPTPTPTRRIAARACPCCACPSIRARRC